MTSFESPAIGEVWRQIASSAERLVSVAEELEESGGATALAWRPAVSDANSVAMLASHTLENVEDNVVYTVGGQGRTTVRDREVEFESPTATATDLRGRWDELRSRCENALSVLPESELTATRVHPRRGELMVLAVLLVVARHGAEHLAHAELTRDLFAASRDSG